MQIEPKQLNVLSLAYMGDSVWEVFVRNMVINYLPNANHADYLHKEGVKFVRASAQAKAINAMIEESILTDEEVSLVKRARNHRTATKAKNADVKEYKWATAFEALLGYLYLAKEEERLNELMQKAAEIIER